MAEEIKQKILDKLKQVKRPGMDGLIKYLEESDFFIAPASARYHLNIKGGLATHSWNVYQTLLKLNETFKFDLSEDTMIVTALLHDLCKIDLYVANTLKSGYEGKYPYKKSDNFPFGHGELSALRIFKYIDLSKEEMLMLKWHMGVFSRDYFDYQDAIVEKFPKILILHFADWMSTLWVDNNIIKLN